MLGLLPPGQIFGEIGFLEGIPATANIVADGDVEIYEMDEVLSQKTPKRVVFHSAYFAFTELLRNALHRASRHRAKVLQLHR